MSHVYMTSDWHFGHQDITKFRTQFPSMTFMEDYVLENALGLVTKRDILYCIGDMAFDKRGLMKLRELPCRKILIHGNHDTLTTADYLIVFDEVRGVMPVHEFWLTHIPIHPTELYRRANIHGHCHRGGPNQHQTDKDWHRYYNAILEFNDYLPVNLNVIRDRMKEQKNVVEEARRKKNEG